MGKSLMMKFMITKVLGKQIFYTQALQCQLNFLLQPSENIIYRFLLKKKKNTLHLCCKF